MDCDLWVWLFCFGLGVNYLVVGDELCYVWGVDL